MGLTPWELNVIPRFVTPAKQLLATAGEGAMCLYLKACAWSLPVSDTLCFIAAVGGEKAGVKPSSPWCWIQPVTGRVA